MPQNFRCYRVGVTQLGRLTNQPYVEINKHYGEINNLGGFSTNQGEIGTRRKNVGNEGKGISSRESGDRNWRSFKKQKEKERHEVQD